MGFGVDVWVDSKGNWRRGAKSFCDLRDVVKLCL